MSHYLTLKAVGRPIAYFPGLAKRLGSTNAAILLGQFIYWHDKAQSELGVYKSVDEIEAETGLSYKSQRTARKVLSDLGLVIETEKRLEHRIYFKFNEAAFEAWLSDENEGNSANCPNGSSGDSQKVVRGEPKGHSVIQEITTENTTEKNTHSAGETKPDYPDFEQKTDDRFKNFDQLEYKSIPDTWKQSALAKYPDLNEQSLNDLFNGFEAHHQPLDGRKHTQAQWNGHWGKWVANNASMAIRKQPKVQAQAIAPVGAAYQPAPPPERKRNPVPLPKGMFDKILGGVFS